MAQIPEAAPGADVVGYRPSTRTVAPTDVGLGAVAEDVAQAGQITDRADRQIATPLALKLQGANESAYQADAAAYTGDNPGFAADQISKAQARAAAALADPSLDPGVKRQLTGLALSETARVGEQANAHEAKVRAQPILDMRLAQDQTQLNGGLTAFQQAFAPAAQQLHDNYDGSTPGYTQNVSQAFDDAATAATVATPERLQGVLQQHLAVMRTEEIAKAATTERHSADAFVLKNGQDQANALINTISSNPLAYDGVVNTNLPAIAATMPAGLRRDLLTEFTGLAATARIKGLVDQGQVTQAQGELADGRYDAFLKPKVKEELEAHVQAALREHSPKTFDEYMAAQDAERRANAETYARMTRGQSTGAVNLDEIVAKLGPAKAAEIATQWTAADRTYATVGAVRDLPTGDLHAVMAQAPPEPTDPEYANKIVAWQTGQQAAQTELKAREQPGAWAYSANPKPKGKGVAGDGNAQDRGAFLQQSWNDYLTATPGAARAQAGTLLSQRALGVQANAGIPSQAVQLVPQAEAARLAATVVNATPEGKLAALSSLAGLIHDLPPAIRMPDGSFANPQAMLTKQLMAAHVAPNEVAAMVDFGADPAKLGRYVAALNDPTLKAALPGSQQANLKAQVVTAIKPFLDSVAPLPGGLDLAQARIDRTVLVAKGLVAHQGMNPGTAAQTAAADMTQPYRFVDTWRMPTNLANAGGFLGIGDGASQARTGAGQLLAQLTANNGANLYAPTGAGGPAARRQVYAEQILHSSRWVTAQDDSGLMLMAPHPDGSWDQVADKFGRPVRATWTQLQGAAKGQTAPFGLPDTDASHFARPPPTALRLPDGTALPAVSKAAAFSALAWSVTGQESHFRDGLVSPKGALGAMQIMPDTVKTYAPRLGLPVDLVRAQNDKAYNRQIGEAALQDHLQHYGSGPGIGLALAAYNAGAGRLEGYTDPATHAWHPGWLQTIGDPRTGRISLTDFVSRIPIPETKAYVQAVLPTALKRLQANH